MLDDPKSLRVKGVTRLHQKDARSETGLFLLEGPQGLKELAEFPEVAHEVYATRAALDRYESEITRLARAGVTVVEVSEEVLDRMADTQNPQGVVAVLSQIDMHIQKLLARQPKLIAVLDKARDPGNAGAVIRAADAAGADGVVLTSESVDIYNSKVVRATAGSILHLPTVVDQSPKELISQLKAAGLKILVADGAGRPLNELSEAELSVPTAWVFGNEAHGVSAEIKKMADEVVSLPIYGAAESLNLATAAAVCLYASAFAHNRNR